MENRASLLRRIARDCDELIKVIGQDNISKVKEVILPCAPIQQGFLAPIQAVDDSLRSLLGDRPLHQDLIDTLCQIFRRGAQRLQQSIFSNASSLQRILREKPAQGTDTAALRLLKAAFNSRYRHGAERLRDVVIQTVDHRIQRFQDDVAASSSESSTDGDTNGNGRGHSSKAVAILEKAYSHTTNITQAEKKRLADLTGLDPRQVVIWFQNRRNRKTKRNREVQIKKSPGAGEDLRALQRKQSCNDGPRFPSSFVADASGRKLPPARSSRSARAKRRSPASSVYQRDFAFVEEEEQKYIPPVSRTKRRLSPGPEDDEAPARQSSPKRTRLTIDDVPPPIDRRVFSSSSASSSVDSVPDSLAASWAGQIGKPRNDSAESTATDYTTDSPAASGTADPSYWKFLAWQPPSQTQSQEQSAAETTAASTAMPPSASVPANEQYLFMEGSDLPRLDADDLGIDAAMLDNLNFDLEFNAPPPAGGQERPGGGNKARMQSTPYMQSVTDFCHKWTFGATSKTGNASREASGAPLNAREVAEHLLSDTEGLPAAIPDGKTCPSTPARSTDAIDAGPKSVEAGYLEFSPSQLSDFGTASTSGSLSPPESGPITPDKRSLPRPLLPEFDFDFGFDIKKMGIEAAFADSAQAYFEVEEELLEHEDNNEWSDAGTAKDSSIEQQA